LFFHVEEPMTNFTNLDFLIENKKDEHLLFFGVEESMTDFTNFDFLIENIPRIKLMRGSASCFKHMSNYKNDEAQSGVIFEYTK
jgi:hypothetical protein